MLGKLFIFLLFLAYSEAISCKGLSNRNVDWFIVYKPPKGGRVPNAGKIMFYLDSNDATWRRLSGLIDDDNQPLGATISQVHTVDPKKTFAFIYNDDNPLNNKSDSSRGHAKGVVLSDASSGYWIVHSAPNFPLPNRYSYPETAAKYGQTFLCVSLPASTLSQIGEHLRYIQATPYYFTLPDNFATRYPVLQDIVNKHSLPRSATIFTKSQMLKTSGGVNFMAYAKHKKFNKDIWLSLIAPDLGSSLAVQGWLNGAAGDLRSDCSSNYKVYDVQSINLPSGDFLSSRDHSKWAVGETASVPVVCIGDMNRQTSQEKRGGGALCFKNQALWQSFYSIVAQTEPCSRKTKNHVAYSLVLLRTRTSSSFEDHHLKRVNQAIF